MDVQVKSVDAVHLAVLSFEARSLLHEAPPSSEPVQASFRIKSPSRVKVSRTYDAGLP